MRNLLKRMIQNINRTSKRSNPGDLTFHCNICGQENTSSREVLTREEASCHQCGSTVRMRSIVHLLSIELFGESKILTDFPQDKSIIGIGMSDWDRYAEPLAEKLTYTNTYYHQEPLLDITNIPDEMEDSLDFVISTDVFEHVLSPVSRAFVNTRRLLKETGAFVFTVPFSLEGDETVEHFGQLHDFEIVKEEGEYLLRDVLPNGKKKVYRDLIFHGGPGSTLEMRVFSRISMMRELRDAGFENIKIAGNSVPEHGIYWDKPWSLPVVARKS